MTHRRRSGFTILCVLMSVVIIMILTSSYMAPTVPGGKAFVYTVIDRAKGAATVANLRSAQTALQMQQMEGRMDSRQVKAFLASQPPPADGGRYFITPDGELMVTTMIQMPLWADRYKLPRVR